MGPKGYFLQILCLADQVLSIPISNIFIMQYDTCIWKQTKLKCVILIYVNLLYISLF